MDEQEIIACPIRRPGPPEWEYTCHDCGHEFKMPAANGPTEEKKRTCPNCGGKNIEYRVIASEACAPGG